MAQILTITMNPAIDISTSDAEGLRTLQIPVKEETRENLTVRETSTSEQFRFVLLGPPLHENEWRTCLDAVASYTPKPDFIVASGSLPPGVPDDSYAQLATFARRWNVPLALDTSGRALKTAMVGGVGLIKPNLGELRELIGRPLPTEASWFEACRESVIAGKARTVALTLGHRGALIISADAAWRAAPLPIEPVSTVGAGDGFLGAMVWALASGRSLKEAIQYGMAGASATLLAPGTGLGEAHDIHNLLERVLVESVSAEALGVHAALAA